MIIKKIKAKIPNAHKKKLKYIYSLIPFDIRAGKDFRDFRKFLQVSQWWNQEQLQGYQMQQLEKLLHHCYKNVPYYKKIFTERKLKPRDISSLDDIQKLPILTKDMIRENQNELISQNCSKAKLVPVFSGGTSGSPLKVYYEGRAPELKERAFYWRMWNWHGFHWKDKCFMLTGAYPTPDTLEYDPLHKILTLYNPEINQKNLERYVKIITRFKPKVLRGYPSLVYLLAAAIEKYQRKLEWPFIKTIFLASEKTYQFQKEKIKKIFQAEVIDGYGQTEQVALMLKCEENQNYHMMQEYGITELINSKGELARKEGDMGEIVGTGFLNYTFPLIRYKTGDWAINSNQNCACQRSYPMVRDIVGRSGDFILTPSGRLVSPTIVEYAKRQMRNFKDCQIIQKNRDTLEIHLVPEEAYTDKDRDRFIEAVKDKIGEKININYAIKDKIERPFNQKKRFIQSELSQEYLKDKI